MISFLKFPFTFFIPAANKLLLSFKAFLAPSSIINSPFGDTELIIHFFLASNFEIFDVNKVYSFFEEFFLLDLNINH
jgi:hypothetical protein